MTAHAALPPLPHNVVAMKPTKATVTITGPDGKTSGAIDLKKLEKAADMLAEATGRKPGKRPVVDVDPEEVAKLEKLLGEEAVAALRDCDHAELRERIVTLSEHEVETEQAMKKDDGMAALKEQLKNAAATYKETIKFLKARRRFAVLLMAERGRPV